MPEGTKVYIATRLERANDHRMLAHALRAGGAVITYDWTLHGSVQEEGAARITQVAVAEADGVADADAVVVLLPGGRGTHAELGMAVALGKPVIVHAENETELLDACAKTCAFYHHPNVIHVRTPWPLCFVDIHDAIVEGLARSAEARPLHNDFEAVTWAALKAAIPVAYHPGDGRAYHVEVNGEAFVVVENAGEDAQRRGAGVQIFDEEGNRFSDYYGRHWVALFFDHGPGPAASLVYAIKEAEGRGVVAGADHLRSRWADLMIFGRDPR